MIVGGNSIGGLTVGFESMISTVLPGSSVDLNANTSVRSRRVSSPGNLRLSALKWLDIVAPSMVIALIGGNTAGRDLLAADPFLSQRCPAVAPGTPSGGCKIGHAGMSVPACSAVM